MLKVKKILASIMWVITSPERVQSQTLSPPMFFLAIEYDRIFTEYTVSKKKKTVNWMNLE